MQPAKPEFTRGEALELSVFLSGYTTAEVAGAAGIASNTLRNAMNGRYPLSDDGVRKVSKYLNILAERVLSLPWEMEEEDHA
jgi:plasmid maintenance system antidote protein VapI